MGIVRNINEDNDGYVEKGWKKVDELIEYISKGRGLHGVLWQDQ